VAHPVDGKLVWVRQMQRNSFDINNHSIPL
jgi:hypothetical protein